MSGYKYGAAYDSGQLPVSDLHTLHFEQYGKENGRPVLFLHGGPGGGTSIANTVYFDPNVYRVVLFDQRGAGKSTPSAELRENTTSHLIADIEVLRKHLNITTWYMVFGGSWGSTLGLLYAESFPERVASLVLRGIFLSRKDDIVWSHPTEGAGASQIFPDVAEEFLNHFAKEERRDWERITYERLVSREQETRVKMARALNTYDMKRSSLFFDPSTLSKIDDEQWSLQHALLEHTYIMNGCWLRENQILEDIGKIQHIPCTIVHGRYDAVCAPKAAWDLHKAMPGSKLVITSDSGHSATDPGNLKELVKACDDAAKL